MGANRLSVAVGCALSELARPALTSLSRLLAVPKDLGHRFGEANLHVLDFSHAAIDPPEGKILRHLVLRDGLASAAIEENDVRVYVYLSETGQHESRERVSAVVSRKHEFDLYIRSISRRIGGCGYLGQS